MAYTRRRPAKKTSSRRTTRSVRRSTRSAGTRRASTRRSGSRSAGPRTIRIVIEQPAATGATRPLVPVQESTEKPRTNKF